MAATDSIDGMIESTATYGPMVRSLLLYNQTAGTAATTSSGYVTTGYLGGMSIPALTSPVTSVIITSVDFMGDDSSTQIICGYAQDMGTLTISGNSFASGTAMPTRTIAGTSVTTASVMPLIQITTTLVATNPVITITYTDQDGNTGQTASLTIPTNAAINSCFLISPHLATGDTGIRAITNISTSAGTGGVLKIYGVIPIAYGINLSNAYNIIQPLFNTLPLFPFVESDRLEFYRIGATSTTTVLAGVYGVPETGF